MKKFALIFMIGISSLAVNAQNASHQILQMPADKTPATVTVLGRDPQFPPLRHLDNAGQVYDQLKAMGDNPMYSSEVNGLFNAMGYNGVADPAFDRNDVTAANLPYGAIGMMGNGKNTYKYSIVMLPNQSTTNAWRVAAKNSGSDLYFLAECGNAFNYSNPERVSVVERETVVKDYSGKGKMKVRVLARTKGGECSWCSRCKDVETETVVLSEENVDDIPVATDGAAYPVKTIYLDVDRKTFKKIKAGDMNTTASKVDYNTLNNVASRR